MPELWPRPQLEPRQNSLLQLWSMSKLLPMPKLEPPSDLAKTNMARALIRASSVLILHIDRLVAEMRLEEAFPPPYDDVYFV